MTCIRLSFSNFLVCHFWWLKNENPFNNKKLQFFRQPDPGHAQQSLAKFGHCGIWSYDLSLGLFFGGRWVEFLLSRKLPFWKHGSEIIELLLYHDHWGFAKRFFCFENLEKTDLLTCRVSLEIDHIAISKVKTLENSGKCRSIGWCKRTWRTLTGRTCWQLEHQKTEVVVSVFVYQRFSQDLPTKTKGRPIQKTRTRTWNRTKWKKWISKTVIRWWRWAFSWCLARFFHSFWSFSLQRKALGNL